MRETFVTWWCSLAMHCQSRWMQTIHVLLLYNHGARAWGGLWVVTVQQEPSGRGFAPQRHWTFHHNWHEWIGFKFQGAFETESNAVFLLFFVLIRKNKFWWNNFLLFWSKHIFIVVFGSPTCQTLNSGVSLIPHISVFDLDSPTGSCWLRTDGRETFLLQWPQQSQQSHF